MIDPSVSVPIARRTIPAATAAPLPLELPQVLRSSAHGIAGLAADRAPARNRVGRADVGPFAQVGLAEDHRARRPKPRYQRRVAIGDVAGQRQAARGRRQRSRDLDIVFDQDRLAGDDPERAAARVERLGLVDGGGIDREHGVGRAIDPRDALQRGAHIALGRRLRRQGGSAAIPDGAGAAAIGTEGGGAVAHPATASNPSDVNLRMRPLLDSLLPVGRNRHFVEVHRVVMAGSDGRTSGEFMHIRFSLLVGAAILLPNAAFAQATDTTPAAPAAAQPQSATPAPAATPTAEPEPADDYGDDEGAIVVTGSRTLPGSVVGDIPPENTLDSRDVRATGATNISELLDAIAPRDRQRPRPRRRGAGAASERPAHLRLPRASRHPHRSDQPGRDPARGSRAQIWLSRRPEGREHRPSQPLPLDRGAGRGHHRDRRWLCRRQRRCHAADDRQGRSHDLQPPRRRQWHADRG